MKMTRPLVSLYLCRSATHPCFICTRLCGSIIMNRSLANPCFFPNKTNFFVSRMHSKVFVSCNQHAGACSKATLQSFLFSEGLNHKDTCRRCSGWGSRALTGGRWRQQRGQPLFFNSSSVPRMEPRIRSQISFLKLYLKHLVLILI